MKDIEEKIEKIEDIMSKKLFTVENNVTLEKAYHNMKFKHIRHLIVTNKDESISGIISDRDIKRLISPFANSENANNKDLATLKIEVGKLVAKKDLITCRPGDMIKYCAEIMMEKKFNAIPIVNKDQKPVGIVTSTDLMKLLIKLL